MIPLGWLSWPFGEVYQTAVMEKAEGDVDGMGSKYCINSARDDRRLRDQLRLAIMICVLWLRLARG